MRVPVTKEIRKQDKLNPTKFNSDKLGRIKEQSSPLGILLRCIKR